MCLPRCAPATSYLLVLLLGRVSGGIRRATCPLSKVYLVDGQNFWTGLPVPAPLAANAGTHAGITRAPMPHATHCTPPTHRTPRSKLQLVPEQLMLLEGGHGADLATGARDPVAAKLARLPRRAAHAHVQLLQPPPGTRSSGIEQSSP